jgi:phosphoglycolate phosphatase-like HAD superfamily hydrolase
MTPSSIQPADGFAPPPKQHETLVGIDSDGCVFDTMGIKQRNHFAPLIIRWWGLEAIADLVLRHIEHINLFSRTRGSNRFPNLVRLFEALAREPAIRQSGIALPDFAALRRYCDSMQTLGDATLAAEVERTQDTELIHVLAWSRALSHDIDTRMEPVPLFAWVRRSLELLATKSDRVVISQTPEAALRREWQQHGIDRLVPCMAGQEQGSKTQQLQLANGGRYPATGVLMIGDAIGDREAARTCGVHFYPILPGDEAASWQRFHDEAYPRFLDGTYAGDYASAVLRPFEDLLSKP